MPKIVDHDLRREQVLDALWRVVRRDGLEGATIRAIAREAGCSSGVLAHYFRDKDDILRSALELSNRRIEQRVVSVLRRRVGLAALRGVLCESLPLDADRSRALHLEVSMWGRAISEERQRREHRRWFDAWRALIVKLLRAAVDAGELPADLDVDRASLGLVAFVDGLAVDALMHPDRVSRASQRRLIEAQLAALPVFAGSVEGALV